MVDGALSAKFTKRVGNLVIEFAYAGGPEILVLFGPSGAGKTMILRCLAGLLNPDRGLIRVNGAVYFDADRGVAVPARRRSIGYVFQQYALFPHLTVAENITFGLDGWPRAAREARLAELLGLFRLDGLETRRPAELSGGQQQRVAVARALARRPQLLLLDEPLAALDRPTRETLLRELGPILRGVGVSTVFVTHDREEALQIGDRLAVLMEGRVAQMDAPERVFAGPVTETVARFVGVETILTGVVTAVGDGVSRVRVEGESIEVAGELRPGQRVRLGIRPEEIALSRLDAPRATSARNRIAGTIAEVQPAGTLLRVTIEGRVRLVSLLSRPSFLDLGLAEGGPVVATFKVTAPHVLPL